MSSLPMSLGLGAGGKQGAVNGEKRKLVIKPLKLKPQLPANFEEDTWAKLNEAVNAVHAKQPVSYSLEQLYRAVEDLCSHKLQARLYERLVAAVDAHLAIQLQHLAGYTSLDPVAFLDKMDAMWRDYQDSMLMLRSIFLVLDRSYVVSLPGLRSLFDTGLQLLRVHLQRHQQVEHRVVEGLLALVERDRRGEATDRTLVARLVGMLVDLGMYGATWEPSFLSASRDWYAAEGQERLGATDVPAYLVHCEARLAQEQARCSSYLEASTRTPLLRAVEEQLLGRHMHVLLERGFAPLLDAHRVADLARMYQLLARIGQLEALKAAWRDGVYTRVARIVKDEANDKDMVERLLQQKRLADEVLSSAWAGSEPFAAALRDALTAGLNSRQNKPAELIAKYIDARLRAGGSKGLTDAELEAALDAALVLFRAIQGKDIFEAFYKRDLAKRLLLGRSASMEAEKLMISKLKSECGAAFTQNIEGMFRDMEVARDTPVLAEAAAAAGAAAAAAAASGGGGGSSKRGRAAAAAAAAAAATAAQQLAPEGAGASDASATSTAAAEAMTAVAGARGSGASSSSSGGVDFQPVVLTQQFWPSQTPLEFTLPEELQQLQAAFSERYRRQYKEGRQLVWQHALATCSVRAQFPKGAKELQVSLLQAVVLVLFNSSDSLSYPDIVAALGIKAPEVEKELRRTLLSLSVGRVRVLTKEPKGPEVGEGDVFSFNAGFSHPLYRIKVNNIQLKETAAENVKTNEQVLQDRLHQIDACIVRVMKARKQLSHKLLAEQVLTQLRFQMTQKDLKKRIDNLIEREFLERSSEDASVYNYLA